ncbi:hypothetical protein [Peribacillus sp. SCS-155]|uniref:hypothetical protein n=1 Tax=Peribacillus sedimenti TaxID=3115297 RepID=UPI003906A0CE
MKILTICSITLLVAIMVLFQWSKMKSDQRKEKISFVCITASAWLLAVLLLFFPGMKSPSELLTYIFKPISELLNLG